MKSLRALVIVLGLGLGPLSLAQGSQEYLVTLVGGRTYSFVMDANWMPTVRQGQIVFRPTIRILAMDVAVIRPFVPNDVRGLQQLKLLPRAPRVQGESVQVWVAFDPLQPGVPVDKETGLVHAAPQTWVRPEAFRMTLK